MKILILGSGLMGPAAAFNAIADPNISQVVLCDASQQQLEAGLQKLVGNPNAHKLGIVRLDLHNQTAAAELIGKFDAVVDAMDKAMADVLG